MKSSLMPYKIWIGLRPELVMAPFGAALATLVLYLHLWAFPLLGFHTRSQQPSVAAAQTATPTR